MIDINDGVEAREGALDTHIGDAVAERLVQISLNLQLELELLLEKRLSLQADDEAADDNVLPAEGLLVGERAHPLRRPQVHVPQPGMQHVEEAPLPLARQRSQLVILLLGGASAGI